jgi:hypothetical protein
MTRQTKSILLIITGLLAACLLISGLAVRAAMSSLADFASDDPHLVDQMGRSIAFFDLPPGFGAGRAVSKEDFTLVSYNSPDGRTHLTLLQVPVTAQMDEIALHGLLKDVTLTREQETAVIDQRTINIRDRQATLTISEGRGANGAYRSATVFFEGLGGPALANLSGPLADWDEQIVDTFLASLR